LRIATSTFVLAAKPAGRVRRIRTAKRRLPSSLPDPGGIVAMIGMMAVSGGGGLKEGSIYP
jgi:hypothetical protein